MAENVGNAPERGMALYKENVTTPDANDKAVYGLRQITAKYNHAKDQLAYTRLYAPVSYTHLDVYKRQDYYFTVIS